jgi:arylsulfatase A-like enzyme
VFDGGMHVPAVISWPGIVPGNHLVRELVMTADILPTVCKLAGAAIPADRTIDGCDILPVITSHAASPHHSIYWANGNQLAVRRGKWKLVIDGIEYGRTEASRKPLQGDEAIFLSDLEDDPGESRNLRHRHPELVDQLATSVHHWRETVTTR